MKKVFKLFFPLFIILINTSQAQEKVKVDAKIGFFLALPVHNDLGQKFDFGAGGNIGAAIFIPKVKTYITPQVGLDFMAARSVGNDDTYRESIIFTNLGLEFMYQLVDLNKYKLFPLIAISSRHVTDRYLVANGNIVISNTGSDLEYNKLPPLFSTSALALNFGIENRFNDIWFIKLSYELYKPEVTANLTHSRDYVDNEIFIPITRNLDLSTIKLGFGAYFW